MAEVVVTDMIVLMCRPAANGVRVLAAFDVEVRGVQIRSASLLQHPEGSLFMGPAVHRVPRRGVVGAAVTDWRLKRAIVRAAHAVAARENPGFPPLALYPERAPGDPIEAEDGEPEIPPDLSPRRHRGQRAANPDAGLRRFLVPTRQG